MLWSITSLEIGSLGRNVSKLSFRSSLPIIKMFCFKTFKNPVFLLSLFAVFVLLASLFLNAEFASAAGTWTHCQGPLVGYDTDYGNDQFDCNNSDLNTYTYYCEETASQLAYCRSFTNPSSDYYDCGSSFNNMIGTANGFLFVNCSLVDTQKPSITNFTAIPVSSSQINLSWEANDNVGIAWKNVNRLWNYNCGNNGCGFGDGLLRWIDSALRNYSDTMLNSNTEYCYEIYARDGVGNWVYSVRQCATTLSDSTPPSNITNLSISSCSFSSCSLSWTASTDDVGGSGIGGYRIYRDSAQVGTAAANATTHTDPELSSLTSYSYYIVAYDNAGNSSSQSNTVTDTTAAEPDTTAPTVPSGLTATAVSSSQIDLSWSASTDAVGVAGYRIERCQGAGCSNFVQINTSVAPNYSDSSLSSSTGYSYRIRAYDAVPNSSNYSNIASATTDALPDTTAPVFTKTAPADLLPSGTLSTNLSGSTNEIAICRWADSTGQTFDSMNPMNPVSGGMNHAVSITTLADGQSYYVKCRDTAPTPNISGDFFVFSVDSLVPDTSPPQISNPQPSGTLTYFSGGSGTVTMSVITNKSAFCRYSQIANTSFDLMAANPLSTASAGDPNYQKYHFTTLTVFNGTNYTYYVRCQDTTGPYTNMSDYPITFSVPTPPNTLPTVNLTASPTSGDAPLQVSANGTANDPDGDPLTSYSLDWGDGLSEGYAPNTTVQHTYNNAGSYTVTLTVWDARMNINASGVSDMEYITVNAPQVVVLPPITGGICAVECNDNSACVGIYGSGFVCGPSHICIPEAAADAGPVRSGEYASLTDGTVFSNFPTGTQAVMINLSTDTNAECRFAVNQSTNNGEAGVAYDFNGAGITMNQFSTSDYRNHFATINIGAAKSCSPEASNSCGYNKEDACPSSGKCNSYGFSAVCRNTTGTLAANTTDYPILFSIGAPELLACIPGERCPSGLECPSSGPFAGRCEPAPYTCLINQYFIKNNIPYLLDICFSGFIPSFTPSNNCVSDGSCNVNPACEQTLTGTDNCGNSCQRTGSACAPTTYSWKTNSWSACTASCGGGTQTRNVWCERSDGAPVADSNCSGSKPATSQPCNTQVCASSFYGGNHTATDCANSDGVVVNDGTYDFCRFNLASCPADAPDWLQHNNWTTTTSNDCGNISIGSCQTASHPWDDYVVENCLYNSGNSTCYANVTQIGCY